MWLLLTLLIDLFGPVSYFQFRFSSIWLRKKQQATGGGGGTQLYEDCFSFQNRFSPSARDEQQTPSLEGTGKKPWFLFYFIFNTSFTFESRVSMNS